MEAAVSTVTGPVIDFGLRVTRSGEEDTVLILAPEGVAGITARIGADRTVLEYQGAVAETLLPGVPGFTGGGAYGADRALIFEHCTQNFSCSIPLSGLISTRMLR